MIEIRRFSVTAELEEVMEERVLVYYQSQNTHLSLLHFLEREYGEHLSFPPCLESPFIEKIKTTEQSSRYYLNEFEGVIARPLSTK